MPKYRPKIEYKAKNKILINLKAKRKEKKTITLNDKVRKKNL